MLTKKQYTKIEQERSSVFIDIVQSLQHNKKLTDFTYFADSDNRSETPQFTEPIANTIAQNLTIIKQFTLIGLTFEKKAGDIFIPFLRDHQKLEKLKLENCAFAKEIETDLFDTLLHNSKLKKLSLAGSNLYDISDEKAANCLAEIVNNNTNLTSLNIAYMGFTYETVSIVIKALGKNTTLTKLSLKHNTVEDATDLNELIQCNSTIKELDLYGSLESDEIISFLDASSKNVSLTSLDIGFSEIDVSISKKIRNLIDNHPKLIIIKCENMIQDPNNLSKEDCETVTNLLTPNATKNIQFSFNQND
jgi:Ran GTPase-activating protein (RanGAP) involved in mRNA processing and transport